METKSQEQETLERNIKEISDAYNKNVESLVPLESKLVDLKDEGLNLLRQLYKQRKFSDPSTHASLNELERQYDGIEQSITTNQAEHYKILQVCYKQLLKFQQLQHNLLVGIINGKDKKIEELKAAGEIAKPVQRENNL